MKVSFIVPCYNESKNIKLFYDDVVKSFKDKYKVELIFINDGSKDNTLEELKSLLKEKIFEIKIINFSRNFGKEAGIYAGLKECSGDACVIIDADMQQPPHLVLDMIKVMENDSDIDIVTYYQEKRIENKIISFFKSQFYKIMSNSTGMKLKTGASDFRLLNRKVIDTVLTLSEHDRFSKGIFSWIGFNTYYLPYIPEKRINGKTSWSTKGLFKYAVSGILSFSKEPLNIIFKLGIFNILVSLMLLILGFIISANQFYFLMILIIFLFGINYIVLGILGEYIYRNYTESRNRPIYIVKEVISNEKNN